jgi:hypothetical protein
MDTEANLNLSNVSIKDLMKTIDKIAESLSRVINKYYTLLLKENNIDISFAPEIQISSSELLSAEMRQTLAELLFTTFGSSYDTAYKVLGVSDANTEALKRQHEKELGYEEIFMPHANYYNQTGNEDNGRPRGNDNQKQRYDDTRQENKVE